MTWYTVIQSAVSKALLKSSKSWKSVLLSVWMGWNLIKQGISDVFQLQASKVKYAAICWFKLGIWNLLKEIKLREELF